MLLSTSVASSKTKEEIYQFSDIEIDGINDRNIDYSRDGRDGPVPRRNLIIGGSVASANDWPYFVHFDSPACGGSLIAPDIVLTAGHCKLNFPSAYGTVHVGQHDYGVDDDGSQQFRAIQHIRHPFYDDQLCCGIDNDGNRFAGVSYDFLIIKLDGQSTKQVVTLASSSSNDDSTSSSNGSSGTLTAGDELFVIGFGDIDQATGFQIPNRLHEVTVNYLTNQQCADRSMYPTMLLPPENLCATDYQQDGCQGDSGGPLLKKGLTDTEDVQVGVVSWGYGCAEQPGVYARVSQGYDWIRQQVCALSDNPPGSFGCTIPTPSPSQHPTTVQPTPAPVVSPTPHPVVTSYPTPSPTRGPTPRPTTTSPTNVPTTYPTFSIVSMTNFSTPQPSFWPTTLPPQLLPGELVVYNNNIELDSSSNTNNNIFDLSSVDRTPLPNKTSCGSITDPVVCCAARDSSDTIYRDQPCIPTSTYETLFSTGTSCEPLGWVQSHEQVGFTYKTGHCNALKASRRIKLGPRRSCSRMMSRKACCMAQDGNSNPCIPAKGLTRFSTGKRCEAANLVVDQGQSSIVAACK
jgi:cell division septation protein DedD